MASVVKIYLRPSARTPVRSVAAVVTVAGSGIEGDHAGAGNRQVTLIEQEAWEAACNDLGHELDAGVRRANLVTEGISLAATPGKRVRVGEALVEVVAETRPCKLMEDAAPGLQEALSPSYRGGVYGRIIEGGRVEIGSPVSLE
jgi:MOSC domain-containing protein YiiM